VPVAVTSPLLPFRSTSARLTRTGKRVPETACCCEEELEHPLFSAQTKRATDAHDELSLAAETVYAFNAEHERNSFAFHDTFVPISGQRSRLLRVPSPVEWVRRTPDTGGSGGASACTTVDSSNNVRAHTTWRQGKGGPTVNRTHPSALLLFSSPSPCTVAMIPPKHAGVDRAPRRGGEPKAERGARHREPCRFAPRGTARPQMKSHHR
jgi:hypothetical protein